MKKETKKYSVIEGKENFSIMSKVGLFKLNDSINQSDLKKLYDFGYTNFIKLG
tara:strand:+ start:3688 stop:3846 length:159 start_codon:yes stop_codon:yes gene_type:complete